MEQLDQAQSAEMMRAAPRFTMMLRTAKLVCESGEFLCVIRDVSASGIRLRLFHPLPAEARLALELANGEHYFIENVWEKDNEAGFRFAAHIDVDPFIAEASPYPKRPVRLRINQSGTLYAGGNATPAFIRDISQQGIGIEAGAMLSLGQLVRLGGEGMPARFAKVRWRRHPGYGLIFEETFRLDELARLAWMMQSASARHHGASASAPHAPAQRYG